MCCLGKPFLLRGQELDESTETNRGQSCGEQRQGRWPHPPHHLTSEPSWLQVCQVHSHKNNVSVFPQMPVCLVEVMGAGAAAILDLA